MEPKHPLLESTRRSVDQQATRGVRSDPRATLNRDRLNGSQGVTPSLKVTDQANDAGEAALPDRPLGDDPKTALHLVEPGGVGTDF